MLLTEFLFAASESVLVAFKERCQPRASVVAFTLNDVLMESAWWKLV